ncbi:MAG: HD domain-containing protein [Bacteroidetes bacterium]|uniref:HD domain-containing protein n=1 Tax=Phaeocystidibacter marisrubri TaxID=1577780 RepID=A0A6L3ZDN8_9FLAO|nr:HD domain-containing protein [Phaeocystidibacter marisrubri]KAB2815955.1 HD domain-containing protein [Phaeocystidibacter marisrubri]TNE31342.1 MAG: HD domain-containing protein [Bacteroidota bacterium]GGH66572.1 phosphohydrolase [Phaeocystidibacter marisrubri]
MAFEANFTNKYKILNDPIYGFISIPSELIFDLIEHPYFQRLRRITQLGLTYLVYPGAYHTRFHHAIGAMHLMQRAVSILRSKGHDITPEEEEAVYVAILLHDIGHGPFSHALEFTLVRNVNHEQLSTLFMERLNAQFDGKLTTAIQIFKNEYPKRFLNELISSQLDMDRLDYLRRDSFYTGVTEGAINSERLLTMLNIANDRLVVDAKGIYSVEKFIVARSLMYWQVYLHKTVLSAEFMLVNVLQRAKELAAEGIEIHGTTALRTFMYEDPTYDEFMNSTTLLDTFAHLDDFDIMASIKEWCNHSDRVLSDLSRRIVERRLFKIEIRRDPFNEDYVNEIRTQTQALFGFTSDEASYYIIEKMTANDIYKAGDSQIRLLYKDGRVTDVAEDADQLNLKALQTSVKRHFICYPKEVGPVDLPK